MSTFAERDPEFEGLAKDELVVVAITPSDNPSSTNHPLERSNPANSNNPNNPKMVDGGWMVDGGCWMVVNDCV